MASSSTQFIGQGEEPMARPWVTEVGAVWGTVNHTPLKVEVLDTMGPILPNLWS